MTSKKIIEILQNILCTANLVDSISVSSNNNQLANLMIYQRPSSTEYLAVEGEPLVPIDDITNILYKYGDNESYDYKNTFLELDFELASGNKLVLFFGDYGHYTQFWDDEDKWYYIEQEVKEALSQYHHRIVKRETIDSYIYSITQMVEEQEDIDDLDLQECKNAICSYIRDCPTDKGFLLNYACESLRLFTIESEDPFDTKSIIAKITDKGLEEELLSYIKQTSFHFGYERFYLSQATNALKLIREAERN